MTAPFATAQDAEDAFYDSIEEKNLELMSSVWETSTDISCLLPMQTLARGSEVPAMWERLLKEGPQLDIRVKHIHWVQTDTFALHLVEEWVRTEGAPQPPAPVYASNLYRLTDAGWKLLSHQNSPAPPPPGMNPQGLGKR